ncbi:hypothetical protein [Yimella sp. cx-51]|uniref:hypothetical protein n=1 Tax=Yimella sp. cx-51 TaxID=2770551 RepID=UPI00165E0F1E|nr:hypothetical protein [Yimella sp. cx-51]MBC9958357.1 hypothetical protein [Yimella sp. cx-51]QTH39739.1 hypothetical protein J5M86_15290 [Yimella sp. cx-51]
MPSTRRRICVLPGEGLAGLYFDVALELVEEAIRWMPSEHALMVAHNGLHVHGVSAKTLVQGLEAVQAHWAAEAARLTWPVRSPLATDHPRVAKTLDRWSAAVLRYEHAAALRATAFSASPTATMTPAAVPAS